MTEIEALSTELKKTQIAYQMALQNNQFKTGFLANAAHELRSPLSSVMGLHQLILSGLCDSKEEEQEFVKQSYQTCQKLMDMLDTLIKVSKIELKRLELHKEPIKLRQLLALVQELTQLQAANYNLKIDISAPEDDEYIIGDFEQLLQTLISLVETGIILSKGGTIQIFTDEHSAIIIQIPCVLDLWLENEPQEKTPKSFTDSKVKLDLSPNLKLNCAQSIIRMMGGDVEIRSVCLGNTAITQIHCSLPLTKD